PRSALRCGEGELVVFPIVPTSGGSDKGSSSDRTLRSITRAARCGLDHSPCPCVGGGSSGRLRRTRATRGRPPCSLTRTALPADRPAGGVRAVEGLAPRGLTSYPGKFQLV